MTAASGVDTQYEHVVVQRSDGTDKSLPGLSVLVVACSWVLGSSDLMVVVDWVKDPSEEFGSSMETPSSTELPGPPLPLWSVERLGTARVGGRPRRLLVPLGFLTTV